MKKILKKLVPFKFKIYINSIRFPDKLNEKKRLKFYSQFIKPGDIVFDVGANIGNRISAFLKLGAKVVAIEPQSECFGYLKLKFGNKITLIQKGLSDKEGKQEMYISDSNTMSSFSKSWIDSVKASGRFSALKWNEKIVVQMTTLDALIKEHGLPKFVKIDVEGYELEVLKGLSKNINLISIEYTVPEQIKRTLDCLEQMALINPEIRCNYSTNESMELELDNWLPKKHMIEIIKSEKFINTGFGDIYIKMI